MKSSKFQFDLSDDLIITEENVQTIGERVALGSVRFLMRYSGNMLDRLYWQLSEDVFRPHLIQNNISDAYDIAQEAICHLCNYIGRAFGDVIGFDKNGSPVTVRQYCFRNTIRCVAHHRTWMHRTYYLHDKVVADVSVNIEDQIQDAHELMTDYASRMNLNPSEEEILHCYMAGIGTLKIADMLGVPASTVWRRRHRIQLKYCKYIDPYMEHWL